MTVFWIVAVLLVVAALLFVIPPLLKKTARTGQTLEQNEINVILYKDQLEELKADLENGILTEEQFTQANEDLKRGLVENVKESAGEKSQIPAVLEKNTVYIVAAFFLIVPGLIYNNQLGTDSLDIRLNPVNARVAVQAEGHQGTIEEQIRDLQEKLQADPSDIEGWVMLARSYYFLKQYQAASDAFARTVALTKESEPQLLADYGDALAMASGRNMSGQPYDAVKKALAIDPNHQKALWLAATAAYQTKDYPTTLAYWETLLAQFPEGSENHTQMLKNIGEVKELMGEELTPEFIAQIQSAEQAQKTGASVSGEVTLDPKLSSQASPTDTVFVYARAASGPRMPLAIIKKQVKDLPIKFKLDDSLAMNPSMKISKFPQVVVSARVTKTGNAIPQPGDLQGVTAAVSLGSQGLIIVINNVVSGGTSAPMAQSSVQPVSSAANTNAKVTGTVSLDSTLMSRVAPTDTVFVFARAASGPRMPLAIIRKQVSDLPIDFQLDDTMAMNPSMKLSKFPEVIVAARISKSGNAMPQSGDLKGSSSVIKVGRENLKIIIDSAVP